MTAYITSICRISTKVEPGFEQQAMRVAETACRKLMKDMHYEARVQAIIQYHAEYLGEKVKKPVAKQMLLTREQYMKVNIEH
jgi:hypothetical protein